MDEIGLIQSARAGDLDAFNRLVLAYQDLVYNQAYRVMGDQEAAEDATQEAFVSAFRNLGGYRGGSFRAWLMRIVTNACYDELRRRQRQPVTRLEPLDHDDEEIESPRWMMDTGETPESFSERSELSRALQNCLEGLPEDFRSIVVLVDINGFDYVEASQVIHAPVGTVKSRLSRARLRLRDCLQGFWELLPEQFRLLDEGTV